MANKPKIKIKLKVGKISGKTFVEHEMKNQDISINRLSKDVGCSDKTLRRAFKEQVISAELAGKILRYLDVDLDDFERYVDIESFYRDIGLICSFDE